ncbi:hypothetical protein [Erwinia sp.]|uniref:hypothetical protein n=1 Tax=Erwinia citreus TaxID=558 RepID=UPI003C743FF9
MRWQETKRPFCAGLIPAFAFMPLIAALLLLTGCSSGEKGSICEGQAQTLDGRVLGNVEGKIVDRFTSFSVTLPDFTLESGPLHSADRQKYVPSAVTQQGWLAMRLSDTRFMVVNAPQDKVLTFTCPSRSI